MYSFRRRRNGVSFHLRINVNSLFKQTKSFYIKIKWLQPNNMSFIGKYQAWFTVGRFTSGQVFTTEQL